MGFIEGVVEFGPMEADIGGIEFGLCEFGTGEDESDMSVGRDEATRRTYFDFRFCTA